MEPMHAGLMRIAAVSGMLDPADLGRRYPAEAMEALAEACDEDIAGRRYRWRMRAGARRQTLNAIAEPSVLRAALRAAPAPEAGDDLGHALRLALGQKSTRRLAATSLSAAHACHAALEFAQDMPVLGARHTDLVAEIVALRRAIAGQDQQQTLDVVLPKGRRLFGRDGVLRAITAFARGAGGTRPIVVSGIGGIGKSAIVAKIMRAAERAPDWSAILLDFDRPTLLNGEPYEIVREIVHQMSRHRMPTAKGNPEAGKRTREAGKMACATLEAMSGKMASRTAVLRAPPDTAEAAAGATPSRVELQRIEPEAQLSQLKSKHFETLRALPQEILHRRVLLIMDTFELITGLSADVVRRVLHVEDILRMDAGFIGFRTVLVGRGLATALADPELASMLSPPQTWISLEGLDAKAGAALLAAEDAKGRMADAALRRRASEALKGHPLALQILARYCQDRTARQIRALVDDISANPDFQAEFAQRFLYSRILDRIPDAQLRALAHPGLVLRHVTPDLIRLVLAGPCGLGALDAKSSAELFGKLAANHWLVSREASDRVRHLPDLRRHMLAAMLAPVPESDGPAARRRKTDLKEKARLVSLAAIALYRDGPPASDPAQGWWRRLSDAERHTEVLYHRALTEPAPLRMDRADAAMLRTGIGEDFESLPKAWSALVKAETDNLGSLSSAERVTLTGTLRSRAVKQRLETLDKAQAFEAVGREAVQESTRREEVQEQARVRRWSAPAASETPALEGYGVEAPGEADLDLGARATRAAFMRGDIEQAAAEAAPLVSAFLAGSERFRGSPSNYFNDDTFWFSGLWLGALAQTAMGGSLLVPDRKITDFGVTYPYERVCIIMMHAILGDISNSLNSEYKQLFSQILIAINRYSVSRFFAIVKKFQIEDLSSILRSNMNAYSIVISALSIFHPNVMKHTNIHLDKEHLFKQGKIIKLDFFEDFYRFVEDRHLSVKMIDAAPSDKARILRGLTPELHTPAAAMLDKMPPEPAAGFVQALSKLAPYWPVDLAFDDGSGQPTTKRFGAGDAMTVVITADRCGILPDLLRNLTSFDPRAAMLLRVHETITERLFTWAETTGSAQA